MAALGLGVGLPPLGLVVGASSCREAETEMIRGLTGAAIVIAALGLSIVAAQAGPCTADIAYFEQQVRQSAGKPDAGPFAPQTVGAQLGYQPTPASIRQAQRRAQAQFKATLARAKRYDARGDRERCMRELTAAKRMYNL
jgi:hypothetical protein